ncbi:MAG: HD domain-containing phosphohydrolase, partial [Thermodesulfobacteriota bacterium]
VAGLLHDIGKIEVSGEILLKAASLSSEEQGLVDAHSAKGAYLLSSVGSVLREVVPIVMSHHEYFMSGYEHNKTGNNHIPLGSRVIAVADAFDAMTSDRPYRKGMPPWEALEEIAKNTGKQFDPDVVKVFKLVIGEKVENV